MIEQTPSTTVTKAGDARVELSDGSAIVCPVNEIEPTERGIRVGARFLPWHRVVRYSWHLSSDSPDGVRSAGLVPRMRVRVILEDGSPEGDIHVVTVDQFEAGSWTLNLIAETTSDDGTTTRSKLYVPWRSVREYERLPAEDEVSEEITVIPDSEG